MEIVLHIEATFESVFLINGSFFEHAEIKTASDEILYITVLPLDAALQSYTIKLLGSTPLTSGGLCLSYKLSDEHHYLRLLERYNYIYTTKKQQEPAVTNNIFQLFKQVKQKNYAEARALMTESLSSSINNAALEDFFADFTDIVENKGYVTAPYNSYFLITNSAQAELFVFETKSGQINNIYEYEPENQ